MNLGSVEPIRLLAVIGIVEEQLRKSVIRNDLPMQPSDVAATWADAPRLRELTGYRPQVSISDGIAQFVAWVRDYYQK